MKPGDGGRIPLPWIKLELVMACYIARWKLLRDFDRHNYKHLLKLHVGEPVVTIAINLVNYLINFFICPFIVPQPHIQELQPRIQCEKLEQCPDETKYIGVTMYCRHMNFSG
jgi:hypothetical protein